MPLELGAMAQGELEWAVLAENLFYKPGSPELNEPGLSFHSVAGYERAFKPLLAEEAREEVRRACQESAAKGNAVPARVRSETAHRGDGWLTIRVELKADGNEQAGAVEQGSGGAERPAFYGALCEGKPEEEWLELEPPRERGDVFACSLSRKQGMGEREIELKFRADAVDEGKLLHCGTEEERDWHLVLGMRAITQEAELEALRGLEDVHGAVRWAILEPAGRIKRKEGLEEEPPPLPEELQEGFLRHMEHSFNQPQNKAIRWAAAQAVGGGNWPFTLIQGPPGTGKTHTVWGILNAAHLVHFQRHHRAQVEGDESGGGHKPRILVCAPSNAAVDVVLGRVASSGFVQNDGLHYKPGVVRVGSGQETTAWASELQAGNMAERVLRFGLNELEAFLEQQRERWCQIQEYIAQKEAEPEGQEEDPNERKMKLAQAREDGHQAEVEVTRLKLARDAKVGSLRQGQARVQLELSFADEAQLAFSTLTSCNKRVLRRSKRGFDLALIDEAAQASELNCLVPLRLSPRSVVLVGDPSQLPATVISPLASRALLSRSLFERLAHAGSRPKPLMLTIQHRMHPEIRRFPSACFYDNRLDDSDSILSLPDEPYHSSPLLPYAVFDVSRGSHVRAKASRSLANPEEAKLAAALLSRLLACCDFQSGGTDANNTDKKRRRDGQSPACSSGEKLPPVVAILTPYKEQRDLVKKALRAQLGEEIAQGAARVETVDSFQGQEADVVIFSAVRASRGKGVGFLADVRRLNVALTRARRSLWVLGSSASLSEVSAWRDLFADAKERRLLFEDASAESCLPDACSADLLCLK